MTLKVLYPDSDKRRLRWLKKICDAVHIDEANGGELFTTRLHTKTRALSEDYHLHIDGLRQAYETRRTLTAQRRQQASNLRRMVLAARNVLDYRARVGIMEPTRLDRYKSPNEALRTEYTKMDGWLEAAQTIIKGDEEAETGGYPVLLEPSRSDLAAMANTYQQTRNRLDQVNLRLAEQRNHVNTLRALVFDLHRELFAWLRARYYNLSAPERREHLRAAGYEYTTVNPTPASKRPQETTQPHETKTNSATPQDKATPNQDALTTQPEAAVKTSLDAQHRQDQSHQAKSVETVTDTPPPPGDQANANPPEPNGASTLSEALPPQPAKRTQREGHWYFSEYG